MKLVLASVLAALYVFTSVDGRSPVLLTADSPLSLESLQELVENKQKETNAFLVRTKHVLLKFKNQIDTYMDQIKKDKENIKKSVNAIKVEEHEGNEVRKREDQSVDEEQQDESVSNESEEEQQDEAESDESDELDEDEINSYINKIWEWMNMKSLELQPKHKKHV